MTPNYDIVLMGATSFVGQITARRFAAALNAGTLKTRVALAGRSMAKLKMLLNQLKQELPGADFPLVEVDSMNSGQMDDLVQSTRVVVSTVGPYDLYGEPLLAACVKQGTHYCDLTGEPQFIHRMMQSYEAEAKRSGACIVHCCGFDSIPSDLGVYFLQQQARLRYGEPCVSVDMRVKAMRGGLSGGTIASLMRIVEQVKQQPALKKVLFDPYALSPTSYATKQRFIGKAQPDWVTAGWVAPFVMATINSKVVIQSSQLIEDYPAESFSYNEGMLTGRGSKGWRRAKLLSTGMAMITVGSAMAPTRWVLQKLLPKPGEGPSEQAQKDGFYVIHHYGETASGQKIAVKVTGDEDPGYGSTSKMLMQAGLALADDLPEAAVGGFWTPASLLGDELLTRLTEQAGMTFELLPDSEDLRQTAG